MWREEDHPRDEQGRFISKDIHDMSADELKNFILDKQNSVEPSGIHSDEYFKNATEIDDLLELSIYINSNEQLYKNAKNIKPIAGYEDQVIHGDKYGFAINDLNGEIASEYSAKEFAEVIKQNPHYHGGNIRLISCYTGADDGVAAQELADCLGVDVLAPNDVVIVYPDGTMKIGYDGSGKWILFKKKVK